MVLIVAGLVVGTFAYYFQPQPVRENFASVVRGPMQVTIDEEGKTRVRKRFVVSAPLAGRVLRIELEPGDRVEAGTTPVAIFLPIKPALLDIRSQTEAETRVTEAEMHIRVAEAGLGGTQANRDRVWEELVFAESQLKRYEELAEQGLVARERLDLAEFEARRKKEALNTVEFEIQDAKEKLKVAQAALEVTRATLIDSRQTNTTLDSKGGGPITIWSPIDGVVLRRLRNSEAIVPSGEPLIEIGNPIELEIVSDFLTEDAVKIRNGNQVLIERWGREIPLKGRVKLVEPSGFTKLSALGVEEQRVNIIIDFENPINGSENLGDGYRVEVRVIVWETDDTLKIPTGSLFRSGTEWAVFKVSDGKALLRKIKIGQINNLEAQVLEGLVQSDLVIVHPSDNLFDGAEVIDQNLP